MYKGVGRWEMGGVDSREGRWAAGGESYHLLGLFEVAMSPRSTNYRSKHA